MSASSIASAHPGPATEVSSGAYAFYRELCQLAQAQPAQPAQPVTSSSMNRSQPSQTDCHVGAALLPSVTAKKLSRDVCRAYSLVVRYLRELEEAGWIRRRQRRHAPSQIELVINPQSSEFKVQSSEFRVQSSAMHSFPLSTSNPKYMHAAAAENLNSELSENAPGAVVLDSEQIAVSFELAAQFHQRLTGLLAEFGINGRRRETLAQAISELVRDHFDPARAEKVLDDVRKGLEHAKKKQEAGKADNAATVGAAILEDYVLSGGQLVLFPIAPANGSGAGFTKRRPGRPNRRPQVQYTDEQRADAEAKAVVANARRADPLDVPTITAKLARYRDMLARANTDNQRRYLGEAVHALESKLGVTP